MRRRGFTLVELLVILGIVAVGLALALPAVEHSAQDARQAHCKNNLKRLGLALHNYHDVYNMFAPGWISRDGTPGLGARSGWQVCILPFADEAPLYNQIDFTRASPISVNGEPDPPFQKAILVYRCPSDPTPKTNPLRGDYGTSNYSGNYGHIPPPRLRPLGMSDFWPGAAEAPMKSAGIFARNSSIGVRDILDGTTNTILASERSVSSGGGIWPGVSDNAHEDDALTDCSHRSRINTSWYGFSSRHKGGVNILMCDGAVRFLSDQVESLPGPKLGLFQTLAGRSDGQVIGNF